MDKIPLIIISGPTASGKSSVALDVAEKIDGEIISADSLQVYNYFNIVSDKADIEARARVPHHLIDVALPDEEFNAGIFNKKAYRAACEIWAKKKIPVLCGGTGLYIRALVQDLSFCGPTEKKIPEDIRLDVLAGERSLLHDRLSKIDPEASRRIYPGDHYRIKRALEVFYSTGKTISELHKKDLPGQRFNSHYFVLSADREGLYKKINRRVDTMVKKGVVEEIEAILGMGFPETLKPFRAIGPAHILRYLKGEKSLEDAINIHKRDSRRFAKRQLTWFRGVAEAEWVPMDNTDSRTRAVKKIADKTKELLR